MVDLAAVGITARWWRNTMVEDWHAGADIGALSDVDMFRINTHSGLLDLRDQLVVPIRELARRVQRLLDELCTDLEAA